MIKTFLATLLVLTACCSFALPPKKNAEWSFAISGDSRNCGNVVVPAIAADAARNDAEFYLHLGDLRAIFAPDEDWQHDPAHSGPPVMAEYLKDAWDDYIHNQIESFGTMPVYVGIGNHETISPKTRQEFVNEFSRWLNAPAIEKQRREDGDKSGIKSYFHWIQGGVDFIYLDNATPDEFDPEQMAWFEKVVHRASSNHSVRAVVVGMHAALPDSLAAGHSMSDYPAGIQSGRQVYNDLLNFNKRTHKHVYIMASHSHFYMSGIFDSNYWRAHGGVLPGWIVGTAGAMRYPLPPDVSRAKEARQKIYGYLLGTVHPDGAIDFTFHEIKRDAVPEAVAQRYSPQFADYCFNGNTDFLPHPPAAKPATSNQ
jgi:hypothetical protein